MRGKEDLARTVARAARIIPAHAGKRALLSRRHRRTLDHPRTCGEKLSCISLLGELLGSPPHMRGKVALVDGVVTAGRITPAHAEKRWVNIPSIASLGDHPRVCGEKHVLGASCHLKNGSPPRMRGKEPPCWLHSVGRRITPAYAGKSFVTPIIPLQGGITPALAGKRSRAPRGCCCSEDHPRVCGEKVRPFLRMIFG